MCIPYRYRDSDECGGKNSKKVVEVLMINSPSGPGLLFPKGGWESDETVQEAARREAIEEAGVRGKIVKFLGYYEFKSKTHQGKHSPEGLCRAAMFAMLVEEQLTRWPEQDTRSRKWVSMGEAANCCRHPWMRDALVGGFAKWCDETNGGGVELEDDHGDENMR
ncbi:nudix hydrolase 16, mitochondrial-like isoform X2 [Andrographis paniculata]|uniref:nudix hydrolase 16, mitochondrial-like isoform X2 n=1 Tax=Andrographis paniculata TaxID=175694 RepID=UPI0021E6D914|nr:nudix hydrolase 16, mitochondrial-like isoform X2 [Andrographis paniculata]